MSVLDFFFGHTYISDDMRFPEKKNLQETFTQAFECINNRRYSDNSINNANTVNKYLADESKMLPIFGSELSLVIHPIGLAYIKTTSQLAGGEYGDIFRNTKN